MLVRMVRSGQYMWYIWCDQGSTCGTYGAIRAVHVVHMVRSGQYIWYDQSSICGTNRMV